MKKAEVLRLIEIAEELNDMCEAWKDVALYLNNGEDPDEIFQEFLPKAKARNLKQKEEIAK